MKHNVYVLITLFISLPCTAMETSHEQKAKIITELTCVTNSTRAAWLTGDLIAIIGTDGNGSICDYRTNTEITKVCTLTPPKNTLPRFCVHPNKKVVAFGDCKDNVVIYNIETKEVLKKKLDKYQRLLFHPQEDIIFAQNDGSQITYMYYKNNSDTACSTIQSPLKIIFEMFHPKQPNLCVAHQDTSMYTTHESSALHILDWDKNSFYRTKMINRNGSITQSCCYSCDGSRIAIETNPTGISILDFATDTEKYLPFDHRKYSIWAMTFHPASFILAGLSTKSPFTICYWDTKQYVLITTTPICENKSGLSYSGPRTDFSNDGTKLMVVVNDTCLILEVPFEVLYKDITKEKAIFTHWALKNYQQNQNNTLPDNIIPDEIINLLAQKTLECSKYSFTNY